MEIRENISNLVYLFLARKVILCFETAYTWERQVMAVRDVVSAYAR